MEKLFRAWDIKEKGWVAGFNMVNYHTYFNKGLKPSIFRYSSEWEDGEYILEQFIGQVDDNDKRIFEGDVIVGDLIFEGRSIRTMGVIVYDKEHASFANKNDAGLTLLHNIKIKKVIGNIHQNPELMGE